MERWAAANADKKQTSVIRSQNVEKRFDVAFEEFMGATLRMLTTWAEVCSDPAYIQKAPSDVERLGSRVVESADRFVGRLAEARARTPIGPE